MTRHFGVSFDDENVPHIANSLRSGNVRTKVGQLIQTYDLRAFGMASYRRFGKAADIRLAKLKEMFTVSGPMYNISVHAFLLPRVRKL